jgi:hypothetical protein
MIPGAKVTVTNPAGVATDTTATGDGSYVLTGLMPGKYSVRGSFPGMTQAQISSIDIGRAVVTANLTLQLTLETQKITVQEQLGGQVDTDPSQSAASLVVSGDTLDALSDDPDDLQADLQALAGPAAGPGGAQFYIDGFTAGDGVLPSKSSIREIRVNQNPFSPEFDAIGYGRTEIFTKPGMDKYRGQVFFNYGNDTFNSRNPYAQQKAPYSVIDPGGSFGGPLNKRSSFFIDVDRRHVDNGVVINATVVDPNTFAIVPFSQVASAPSNRLRISPRVDYQIAKNHTLMFRYGLTSSNNDGNGIGGFNLVSRAYTQTLVEHAFQATETAVLSNKVIDETHFQFLHQHQTQISPDHDPTINVSSAFVGGGGPNPNYYYFHHHYEVQNYVSIAENKHTIKAGVRIRAVSIQDSTQQNFQGTYSFGGAYAPILNPDFSEAVPGVVCNPAVPTTGCQTISSAQQYQRTLYFTGKGLTGAQIRSLGGGATQFSLNAGNPLVLVGQVDAGLFAGDDWRIKQNLTFSYGLRYEIQTNINAKRDVAPRIALAWAPGTPGKGGRQKTVIRFGSGVFYDRFNEQNILIAERFNGISQTQFTVINADTYPAVPSVASLHQFSTSQTVHTVSPLLVTPYVIQTALGVERQLPKNTTIAVTWTNSHGLHELRTRNIDSPLPGTYTGVRGSGVYPFGNGGPILEMESAGLYNQNQIVTNLNSRVNSKVSMFGFYTLNFVRSNTDGVNTYPANQYDLSGEYGPGLGDVRHRASAGGSIATWWDLRFAPLINVQSGQPFNIITSQDIYGDTLTSARPGIATNPNQPGVIKTVYGYLDPNPVPGEPILPHNFGRGPSLFSVDLRISRTFALRRGHGERAARPAGDTGGAAVAAPVAGPARRNGIGGFDGASTAVSDASLGKNYQLTVSASGRNIFNHVNQGPIIGNINSPLFGQSNELAAGNQASSNRRLEFQLRLAF